MLQKLLIVFAIIVSSVALENKTIESTEKLPNPEDDYPMEVQSAQCTITTGDVQASAQAKISKRLEGVCGSKEMALAFQTLEFRLMQELQIIRIALNNYINHGTNNVPNPYATYNQQYQPQTQYQQPVAQQQSLLQNYHLNVQEQPYYNYNNPYQQNQVNDNGYQSSVAANQPQMNNYYSPEPNYHMTQLSTQYPQNQYTGEQSGTQSTQNYWHPTQFQMTTPLSTVSVTEPTITASTSTFSILKPLPPIPPTNENSIHNEKKLKETPKTSEASSILSQITTSTTTEQPETTPRERVLDFRPVQVKSLEKTKAEIERQRRLKLQKMMFSSRDFEVDKFNNTILTGDEIRIFSYYWKIENFTKSLGNNMTHLSSPVFSISGLHLKVNAQLNHLNRDYLYLQVESVATEMIERDSNIVLETGHLFKEIETKKYFRHKISILDQASPSSDIISQEFMNTNSGFSVPNSAIIGSPYTKNDNVLVKIQIFL